MLTYAEAKEMMDRARNGRRKLENNTWLERRSQPCTKCGELSPECDIEVCPILTDGKRTVHLYGPPFHGRPDYAVRFHQTDVVTLRADGSITLDSGGWHSVTTKDRINRYAPGSVASDKGAWYYHPHRGDWVTRYPFADGMTISPDGTVTGAGVDETAIRRELLKRLRAYVDGYAAYVVGRGGLEEPGPGDCWGCYFTPPDEKAKDGKAADHVMGVDHILSHFQDKSYVPSLLWRAMQRRVNPAFCWAMADKEVARGDTRSMRYDLRNYLKRITPALVAHVVAHGWPATED